MWQRSNEWIFKIWARETLECPRPSPPSCPVHITQRYSAKPSEKIFSFIGSFCQMQTSDIIIVGRVLSAEGRVCSPSRARHAGTTPSAQGDSESRGDLWPRLQGYKSFEWSLAGLQGIVNEVNVLSHRAECSALLAPKATRPNFLH